MDHLKVGNHLAPPGNLEASFSAPENNDLDATLAKDPLVEKKPKKQK